MALSEISFDVLFADKNFSRDARIVAESVDPAVLRELNDRILGAGRFVRYSQVLKISRELGLDEPQGRAISNLLIGFSGLQRKYEVEASELSAAVRDFSLKKAEAEHAPDSHWVKFADIVSALNGPFDAVRRFLAIAEVEEGIRSRVDSFSLAVQYRAVTGANESLDSLVPVIGFSISSVSATDELRADEYSVSEKVLRGLMKDIGVVLQRLTSARESLTTAGVEVLSVSSDEEEEK